MRPCIQPDSIAATLPPRSSTSLMRTCARAISSFVSVSKIVRPGHRIDDVGDAAFVTDDCCVRNATLADSAVGSASASSLPLVCSDAFAQNGGECLDRHAHDVVIRFLGGQR